MIGEMHDDGEQQLDSDEATALMEALPDSWERLQAAREDIREGRTLPLSELEQRGSVDDR